ncbi:hypothetical protein [Parafrankia sp. BMG5.11]
MSHWMVLAAVAVGAGAATVVIAPDLRRYLEFSRM